VIIKRLAGYGFLPLFLYSLSCFAQEERFFFFNHAYLGLAGGYGSTTWEGLVPTLENQNLALSLSTPIKVTEGGTVWGLFAGYEFIPALALELNYLHFPKAEVLFDPISLFSFENNDLITLVTQTETVNLMAKIMLPIARTAFRLYSSAGVAGVHRQDILADYWRLSPTFGVGLNYCLGQHWMAEISGNYTAGYGESQLSPSNSYFPFLYSVTGRLAYRF
jgi:hypothetical protein